VNIGDCLYLCNGRPAGRNIWGLVRGFDQSYNVDVVLLNSFVVWLIIFLIIYFQGVEVCSPVNCRMFIPDRIRYSPEC
jgi:uncharacterized membrane protein YedE/YeeE